MISKKIRKILSKRGNMPASELAFELGVSQQNLQSKLKRSDEWESELNNIAETLDCTLKITFIMNDSDEMI